MALIMGSLQLGFIYGILAIGIYISFRILNTPDLTAEGSFTLGLAVSAVISLNGYPLLAIAAGFLCGLAAGLITGIMQTKLKIHPILAGIITMSGLYSVNIFIIGGSNLSLISGTTIYKQAAELTGMEKDATKLMVSAAAAALFIVILALFFKTKSGLYIRAVGDNEDMVRASSINADVSRICALAISNGCIAASGALLAQYQGFADISSGVGILVVGLASVIIGEIFGGRRGITHGLICSVAGSIVYRYIIAAAIKTSIFPAYMLKLVSAVIVAAALAVPAIKSAWSIYKQKKNNKEVV